MKFITHFILTLVLGFLFIPSFTQAEEVVFDKVIRTYQEEGFYGVLWNYAFNGVQWLSDNSLAVTGNCNIRENYTGGLYLFDSEGNYEEKENSCHVTSNTRVACPEGGGCQMGWQLAEKGSYLIREGQAPSGIRRSPLVYRKSGNSLSYINRLFFTDIHDDIRYPTGPMDEWEEWAGYYSPVVVDDTLVVLKTGTGLAYSPSYNKLVGLSVPNLNVLWEEFPEGSIAGAIDDVLVLAHNTFVRPLTTTLIAYRIGSDGLIELNRIEMPGSVQGNKNLQIDAQNSSIGAVAVTQEGNTSCKIIRLRKTSSGIEKIDERSVTLFGGDGGLGGGCGATFSISGDYVAFALGTNAMRVWKGTTELDVEEPDELWYEPGSGLPHRFDGRAADVDIRADGKIAMAMGGKVALFSISDVEVPPPVPPGGGTFGGDLVFTARLAENILRVMGSGQCPTQSVDRSTIENAFFSVVRSGSPVIVKDQFFDCVFQKALAGTYAQSTSTTTQFGQ